jgi:hypothetical protein
MAVDGVRNIKSIEIALSKDAPEEYTNVLTINGDQEPVVAMDNILVAQGVGQ